MAVSSLSSTNPPQFLPQAVFAAGGRSPEEAELAQAFAQFSAAAKSLERSYFSLGEEVCRLRKELEEERDLRRRREALAEISALVAHEIRNPLGSMELFAGLLADSSLSTQEKEWVEQIRSALRLLSATVNNVLEFHSRRRLEFSEVELNGLLQSVELLLQPVLERAGMQWAADFWPSLLPVRADRQRLEQVFLNLALNAVRFAASGRVLRVSTRQDADAVTVSFEDNGPGIAPEVLANIFEARVTTCASGSGLGLAIAKQIVEQHGGRISAKSKPGQGACFEVVLPLARLKEEGGSL